MMSKAFTVDWKGDELLADVLGAAKGGVDAVTLAAIRQAIPKTPVDTGELAGGYGQELATIRGDQIVGAWGNSDWKFWIVEARHPSQAGFARRAADAVYPTLTDEIKRRLPK